MGQGWGEEGKREVEKATFPTLLTMIVGLFYWILYSVIIIVCMQDGSAVLIRDIVLLWLFCNSNLPVYFDHFFGFLWGLENILNSSLSFKLDCVSGISGGKGEGGKRKRERAKGVLCVIQSLPHPDFRCVTQFAEWFCVRPSFPSCPSPSRFGRPDTQAAYKQAADRLTLIFSCLALLLACLSKIILSEQDLPEALPNGKVSFKSTVKPLLSGHLHNLPKCRLNRGCPLKRGFLTFVQCLLTMNLQRLLCTVLKFHVVKEAKEAVLYFVQDF